MASVDAFGGQAGLVEREEKGLSLEKREEGVRKEERGREAARDDSMIEKQDLQSM